MKKVVIGFITITFAIGLVFLFFGFNVLSGSGMEPNIKNGKKVVTRKFMVSPPRPERGDVVLYQRNDAAGELLQTGRVIALPLEEVRIQNGNVYLRTKKAYKLIEDYIQDGTKTTSNSEVAYWFKLAEHEYLIASDNRAERPVDLYDNVVSAWKIKERVMVHF